MPAELELDLSNALVLTGIEPESLSSKRVALTGNTEFRAMEFRNEFDVFRGDIELIKHGRDDFPCLPRIFVLYSSSDSARLKGITVCGRGIGYRDRGRVSCDAG